MDCSVNRQPEELAAWWGGGGAVSLKGCVDVILCYKVI